MKERAADLKAAGKVEEAERLLQAAQRLGQQLERGRPGLGLRRREGERPGRRPAPAGAPAQAEELQGQLREVRGELRELRQQVRELRELILGLRKSLDR